MIDTEASVKNKIIEFDYYEEYSRSIYQRKYYYDSV